MIEPVICARTTSVLPSTNTNIARMTSARLPKLMVSSPPMAGPTCSASCSVDRRTQSASTATPSAPETNTQTGGRPVR